MAKKSRRSIAKEINIESEKDNLLIIDDGSPHYSILPSTDLYDVFRVTEASSFEEAQKYLEENSFKILIINQTLDYRSKNSDETGSEFIIKNSTLLEQTKLVVLTEFGDAKVTKLDELNTLGIKIARTDVELMDIIGEIIDGNYKDKGQSNFQSNNENNSSSSAAPLTTDTSKPVNDKTKQNKSEDGISPHIHSDQWTTEDALGYEDYAYAIYRFMTHEKTKPPLTISIQAPWGGGKTSLMRMVRKLIDPDVDSQLKEAARKPNGELKLKEALTEIKQWIGSKANRKPLEAEAQTKVEEKVKASNFTVWFNAWKYENTNQVWAGLIDAVLQQVAGRLPVKERELFWLRLNLKRVDTDKIRSKIQNRIFNYFWRGLYVWGRKLAYPFIISVLLATASWMLSNSYALTAGTSFSVMGLGTILVAIWKYLQAKKAVEDEPAVVSLNDYLEIPNYNAEFGFIHRAEMDLKHVLESIPEKYKPLVIFIDDLDRCSPTKISQVVEAVNLFLAGDFPHCMFVIGMDTEMVAAALQSAHKDMIANLPTDLGIPVGWRFMDKFVQLPFLIPPCKANTKNYVDSLFQFNQPAAEQVSSETQERIWSLVKEQVKQDIPFNTIQATTDKVKAENNLTEEETQHFHRNLQSDLKRTIIDKGIKSFTDKNKKIRDLMDREKAFDYFEGNPRELKRFVNAFRFNYFLWWAQSSQGSDVVSLEQLLRWTIISMKWAEAVRWLRRGDGSEWATNSAENKSSSEAELVARLKLLEETSMRGSTFPDWKIEMKTKFNLDEKTTNWLNDEDLYQFFRKEGWIEAGKRLSDGIGKGIW